MEALSLHFDRLRASYKQNINARIFRAILTVGSFALVVKLVAMSKELVVAYQFGTRDALDAFLIAFLLPSLAINVVAGSFVSALVPTYIHVREREGAQKAQQLLDNVTFLALCLLLAVLAVLALTASHLLPILGSGFNDNKLLLTTKLFYLFLPALPLNALSVIWGSLLNAGERFALAAATPVLTPVLVIAAFFALGREMSIDALAVATVVGIFLETMILAWAISWRGFRVIPWWHGYDTETRAVVHQYVPMLAGAALMSGIGVVEQGMAAMLAPGSVASLSYGNKVVALVLGLSTTALGTVLLPHFSRMEAQDSRVHMLHTFKVYSKAVLLVSLVASTVLVCFSEDIVRLVFQRGAFTSDDTHLVGKVQAMYALQVPFHLVGLLAARFLSALRRNDILLLSALISLPLNAALNYILMLRIGVAGIALSSSVTYLVSCGFTLMMLKKILRER